MKQIKWTTDQNSRDDFDAGVRAALNEAEQKFPLFPTDPVHMTAIMVEEAGESMQAAIDLFYGREYYAKLLQEELLQTAAMCARAWTLLEAMRYDNVSADLIKYEGE